MGITRTNEFIGKIKLATNPEEIKNITIAEREYLKDNYSVITSLKRAYTDYRNEVKNHVKNKYGLNLNAKCEGDKFETPKYGRYKNQYYLKVLTKLNDDKLAEFSKLINYDADIIRKIKTRYIENIIEYFGSTNDDEYCFELNKVKETYNQKLTDFERDLINLYDYKKLINKGIELINSDKFLDKFLALVLFTGRRDSEIGATAKFEYINDKKVLFTGQLKTKNPIPYEIPILYSTSKIIKTLKDIREEKPHYINQHKRFHSNNSTYISEKVKYHFNDLIKECTKGLFKDITSHTLRALYASIIRYETKKNNPNENTTDFYFFSKILGHSEKEKSTTHSYFKFNVVN